MENETTGNPVGRRDVLKKGAVVAATAWTVPMIASSKVGASSGGTCQDGVPCTYVYVFKVGGGSACDPFQTTPCASAILSSGAVTVTQACIPGASGGYSEGSGGSVTLPPGYDVINVIGKKGSLRSPNFDEVCTSGLGGRKTLDGQCRQTVSLPAGYSHMYVVVCSGTSLGGTPVVAARALESQSRLADENGNPLSEAEPVTPSPNAAETPSGDAGNQPPETETTTTTTTTKPTTTEATTTTSEATTTTSEATTTTTAAPRLDDGSASAP